ncbi:SLAM family member 5 [Brachionichthys hirsutus]|uniref:SLAM family member 5 n=1 Tax=Brachionichthys hirsutus TaxID=412623 RepID=UPI0036051B21
MAGVHLHRLIFLFTCSSVRLPWVCLHDVEASSCQTVVHKKVGDAVQLSPCASTEGVLVARWKYEDQMIADIDAKISEKRFESRLYLNPTNFTLTVRSLTLQDSGHFTFISGGGENNQQRPTDVITLQVHANDSCAVFLDCGATSDRSASYLWTVGNRTSRGSRLQYILQPPEGATDVSCTVDNFVSRMSESTTVKCSNDTQESSGKAVFLLSAAGAVCLLAFTGIVICVCHYKRCQPRAESNDVTEYAAIYEVAFAKERTTETCTANESTENNVDSVTPGLQAIYDKIQLSRIPDGEDAI